VQTTADLKDFEPLALACRALSHPARLAILRTLAQRGVCICGEIVDVIPLSQATVSQHLKVLREAGLIRGEIDGPRSCYCIDETKMQELRERIEQLFSSLETCCRQGDERDGQE
jgi:ArsR family transcriptional regulator, arsenate/arsenite/antimonite-responsive transcriptional repressor